MKPEQMTEALETAANQLDIKVRYEPLPPGGTLNGGGLCRVRGQWQLIVDKKAPASDRAAILVETLAQFDIESVYLPPKVRELVLARKALAAPVEPIADPAAAPGAENEVVSG